MATHAAHAGVQNADVEDTVNRPWVCRDEVVGNIALPETLAVQRYAKLFKSECLRLSNGEHMDPSGRVRRFVI